MELNRNFRNALPLLQRDMNLGGKAVDVLVGEQATAIREAVVTLGTMVVGSVAATWVSVTTSFHLVNDAGEEFLNLQKQLDSVYPGCHSRSSYLFAGGLWLRKKFPCYYNVNLSCSSICWCISWILLIQDYSIKKEYKKCSTDKKAAVKRNRIPDPYVK